MVRRRMPNFDHNPVNTRPVSLGAVRAARGATHQLRRNEIFSVDMLAEIERSSGLGKGKGYRFLGKVGAEIDSFVLVGKSCSEPPDLSCDTIGNQSSAQKRSESSKCEKCKELQTCSRSTTNTMQRP